MALLPSNDDNNTLTTSKLNGTDEGIYCGEDCGHPCNRVGGMRRRVSGTARPIGLFYRFKRSPCAVAAASVADG